MAGEPVIREERDTSSGLTDRSTLRSSSRCRAYSRRERLRLRSRYPIPRGAAYRGRPKDLSRFGSFPIARRGATSRPSLSVWQPLRKRPPTNDRLPFGRPGDLRRDGRSRPQSDLPSALCAGEERRAASSGRRRRLAEVEPGATAQPDEGQHPALRRDRRSERPKPPLRAAAVS